MRLTEEFLYNYFGEPKKGDKHYESFHYAIQPYSSVEEYNRDRELMAKYNTPSNLQDNFLLVIAAKTERTDGEILGIKKHALKQSVGYG